MIIQEYGVKELYRGLVPILLRNGPSNALFFVLREEAQKLPQKVSFFHFTMTSLISNFILNRTVSFIKTLISSSRVLSSVHLFQASFIR